MSENGIGQEYLDENLCLHDWVSISDFEVINSSEDVLVTLSCNKCGETQQQTLCIESILDDLKLGWEE
jgi:hypothetical protein